MTFNPTTVLMEESLRKATTPLKAIRQYCLQCTEFQPKEVRLCGIEDCPLFRYRMGRRIK